MHQITTRILLLTATLTTAFGFPSAQASYYDLTKETAEPQECIIFDARYPYWTNGIYIATYPHHSRSKEGWDAPYYGGVVTDEKGNKTLLQFASWQMSGKGAPTSGIDFVHAGLHMSWKRSTWEGSSGGFRGDWPEAEFKRNQWFRFVHRVWTPSDASTGLGFAGVWMKSLETGEWHHLATFKFPADLTGFNAMGGFNERFAGNAASQKCAVEFRNSYALRNGNWTSEAEFSARNAGDNSVRLVLSEDKRAVLMETTSNEIDPATNKPSKIPVRNDKVTLTQPALPDFFDPVVIDSVTSEIGGRRAVVRWKVGAKNSPQLGYDVALLDGARIISSEKRNDPEARLCVLELTAAAPRPLKARITITDIFGNVSKPIIVPIPASTPVAPIAASAAAGMPGLTYRYFEATKGDDWMALPDFTKLTPVRQGAVATPDITPRLRREGYAFEFTGFLLAPESALYTLSLTGASAGKLLIDDKPLIDADGYHSIARYTEAVPLLAGLHSFRLLYAQGPRQLQQPDDFLQLSWSRPGSPDAAIPGTAFRRRTESLEPRIAITRLDSTGVNLTLASKVEAGSHKVDRVEYYGEDSDFDYFAMQGSKTMDYFLTSSSNPNEPVAATIWGGPRKTVRARLIYDGNHTVDSTPVTVSEKAAASAAAGYRISSLEHHLYPMGAEHTKDKLTLVGESTGFYTRPHKGNVTLIAHLADITPDKPNPDGTRPQDAANWFSGIILRANLNPRPGEPLGGQEIPFTALMGSASAATRHCDSTMINGAGNQPSANIGSDLKWFKLVRRGADLTTYASRDGADWKLIKTVNLPKMPEEFEIGFVHYSIPSATPVVHKAVFDHITIGS